MNKPVVYLVAGVSGSGKSWVCEQLKHHAKYVPYDKVSTEEALSAMRAATVPVLFDPVINVSTFIKRNSAVLDIKLVVITGDFIKVKKQLIDRGGRVTKGLYRRWNRMKRLSISAVHSGSSEDVLKFLKEELKRDYSIYKATTPSGKVYIGKTSGTLSSRISAHRYDAVVRKKEWAFSRAIRKYGHHIKWTIICDKIYSYSEINYLEKFHIMKNKSNQPEYGYNLTDGGDGGQLVGDSYLKKAKSLKVFYSSPKGIAMKKKLAKSSKIARKNKSINEKIKAARGTEASKLKTSIDSKHRYENKEAREKLSTIMVKVYKDDTLRARIAAATRKARAKPFTVWDNNGTIVGSWDSASTCAEEMNLSRGGISACLNGYRGSVNGYRFKWDS